MRVEEGYRVRVFGGIRGRIDVVEGILGLWVGAVLCKVKGLVVLELVG